MLESRLDNIIFRAGFANSRKQSRQIVNHGPVLVNGKRVDIPSYLIKAGDVVSVKENSLNHPAILASLENKASVPAYLEFDAKKFAEEKLANNKEEPKEEKTSESKEKTEEKAETVTENKEETKEITEEKPVKRSFFGKKNNSEG